MKYFIICSLLALAARAKSPGESLYQLRCMTCHGEQAQGQKAEGAPRLRGQFDWYIVSSLKKFVSGERKSPKKQPSLRGLTEQDFKQLAAYLSGLK